MQRGVKTSQAKLQLAKFCSSINRHTNGRIFFLNSQALALKNEDRIFVNSSCLSSSIRVLGTALTGLDSTLS